MDWILWPGCVTCGLLAVSGYAQMARARNWREGAGWTAPLIFTSAAAGLLALLGVLPPLPGAFLAAVPLAVVTFRSAQVWRLAAASRAGKAGATRFVLSLLLDRLRGALWNAREDLRDLAGLLRRGGTASASASAPGPAPGAGAASASARPRRTPSVWNDPGLGPVPVPAQVATDLESAGVIIPPAWAAVAEREGSFEPEDQGDLRQHWLETAAGILTAARAFEGNAEDLASGRRLDPGFTEAVLEFAGDFADFASSAAMVLRAYENAYDGVNEHVDGGGTLPEDSPGWFGASPPDGQAA